MVKKYRRYAALLPVILAVLAVAAVAIAVAASLLLDDVMALLSFKTVGLNYESLRHWVHANYPTAIGLYVAVYASLAVSFLPGSALMVVVSGLLFGAGVGVALSWATSVSVAALAFLTARALALRLIPSDSRTLRRLRDGFSRNGLSYMLFLRLSPGLPFALVNAAPAALGVPLSTFVIGTAVGFVPSRIALSTAGAGLAGVLSARNAAYNACISAAPANSGACRYDLNVASLLTPETVAAFVALALLALVPALIERMPALGRRADGNPAGGARDCDAPTATLQHGSTQHVDGESAADRRAERS